MAALGLSLGTTTAGVALMATNAEQENDELIMLGFGLAAIGPYTGYLYTGDFDSAKTLGLVQGIGVLAMVGGASMVFDGDFLEDNDESPLGGVLIIGGAAAVVGGAAWAILDAPRSAERMNEKRRAALRVGPTPVVGPQRSTGLGLGLSGSF